uniref:TIR domain-containing protein n=1 Tax=Gasterosteus aculeatus aculeatus TaxID=481459 RepID=G3NPD4_GASAC|nr:toll-like receptor 22 [Gasterosteus aculeatus aculeatus]
MANGVKEDKTMEKRGFACFKLSFVFFMLNVSSSALPVRGFYLKSGRITDFNASCSRLHLQAVPRDIPSTVRGFDLSENRITMIQAPDFKNFSALITLDLKRNMISQIDAGAFADLISLKTLNLNNNRLTAVGDDLFHGLSNLTELRINNNRIKNLSSTSFESLTSLTFLDMSYNRLHLLTKVHTMLQQLPNLLELSVKSNLITSFHSWDLTNRSLKLTSLDLSLNDITVFKVTADVFPNLTSLSIGRIHSKRTAMQWDIRGGTFFSRVSTLDISGLKMDEAAMRPLGENFNPSLTSLRMNAMRGTRLTKLVNVSCSVPTVSRLQMQQNNLHYINAKFFQLCANITEMDLGKNSIANISYEAFRSLPGLKILNLSQNKLAFITPATGNLPTLEELDLSQNYITTLGCNSFANLTKLKILSLHQNSIPALRKCVFEGLIKLQVVKLQNNSISKLDGAFSIHLPNLKRLRLNINKLTAIKRGDFAGLQSLESLALDNNMITTLEHGSFKGLSNLTELQLSTNRIDETTLPERFRDLVNLESLDLSENRVQFKNAFLTPPPFSGLSRLRTLVFLGNGRRGKFSLPYNLLEGLTNLSFFSARKNQLSFLHRDTFNYTPRLQTLDIGANDLRNLSSELFHPIGGLESLYISKISLDSLDFLIDANLTKLEFIQGKLNQYSVLSEEVIKSMPSLVYLNLQGNSFTCDCDNAYFRSWIVNDKQTQVYEADKFLCNYPSELKGKKLLELDVKSCTVNTEFIYFISTTSTILLFMLTSLTYHFMRWQLVYAYYLFLALLFDTKLKNKQQPKRYDAFVSYNTSDEPWVMRQLLPKLEGEQGWRLCLHHRDFEPGKPIIDNITDAIYGSRKTICVISRRYLESEWCSTEIQVASFRLFDERKDVLVLVFLEDIPGAELSPYYRMRKLLKRRTYLSWPRAGQHPNLFWEKLRQALGTKDDPGREELVPTLLDRQ